jgi:ribosomal protein L3 glutamine methyltransferase
VTKEQLFNQLVQQLSSEQLFFGHAVVDAEDEAMMLMMHLFKQDVTQVLASGADAVSHDLSQKAFALVQQRLNSLTPMAYILGTVTFAQFNFKIDKRALIPRSPIAELIINKFSPWVTANKVHTALDMCTGSGCIGIAMAKHIAHIKVDIADISSPALALAASNISLQKCRSQVQIIRSDLFAEIHKQYDLIVTNPPYVSDAEYQELPQEYKHEPKLGLVTEMQGLQIPVKILYDAANYLNNGGFLFLEVGYSDVALDKAFSQVPFEWIDFLNGGQGVCVFSKKKLLKYQAYFKAYLESSHVI